VERVKRLLHVRLLACVLLAGAYPTSLFACQESCVILATTARKALFEDGDGKPLANVEVVIRDASKDADGPECSCGRFGPMISHVWTDGSGRLSLEELHPGQYWITYMSQQDGESFYVSIEKGKRSTSPLELQINHFGNRCYLVDVERNETKPNSGWPKPLHSNAKTH
jgi:hypothetical protein